MPKPLNEQAHQLREMLTIQFRHLANAATRAADHLESGAYAGHVGLGIDSVPVKMLLDLKELEHMEIFLNATKPK